MFDGMTIQMVFLIVIGAAVLVTGTTSLRRRIRMKRYGSVKEGKILRSKHIEKRDNDGYLIQNYYEVMAEYTDSGHKVKKTLKSVDEYREGDEVKVFADPERGGQIRILGIDKTPVFGPFILMGAGILIIVLPFVQKQFGEQYISAILALLLLLVGTALIASYIRDRKKETEEVPAVIAEILKWQPSEKKKWSSPSASYYPILKFTLDGRERTMRSRYNSSTASSYKKGKQITLYRDRDTGDILERGPKKSMAATGILLILFACVGIYSTAVLL